MYIERKPLVPHVDMSVAKLREHCVGCKDCKGTCLEILQMIHLPDMLREMQETSR